MISGYARDVELLVILAIPVVVAIVVIRRKQRGQPTNVRYTPTEKES
ncbi:hypothetical protein HLB23_12215 [Nocardia uniformis]|uniref:Uncharacterized protein n=1 Tax=Nocardia uniformis TaxID=53432 RepID=A0A849BZA2_9NOCA|nr:hypothetical protein [Nocardia uniformis]NNH70618.1 hypothetical protein [Nocardia uniformis]